MNKFSRVQFNTQLICPICGEDYHHLGEPHTVSGEDSYKAWAGRGDRLVIPIEGECGHNWSINIGFHKGWNYIWAEADVINCINPRSWMTWPDDEEANERLG